MVKSYFFFSIFIFSLLFHLSAEHPQYPIPEYRIHDLGTLASEKSEAMKINNDGKIFGTVHADKPFFFTWDEKEGIKMFPLPLQDAIVEMVNNHGQTIIKHEKKIGWIFSTKVKEYYFWNSINDQLYKINPPKDWKTEFVVTSLNDKGQFVIVDPDPSLHPRDRMSAYWDGSAFHTVDKKIMDTVIKITNDGTLFGYLVRNFGNGDKTTASVYHPENQETMCHPFFSFEIDSKLPKLFRVFYTDNGTIAGNQLYHYLPSTTYIKKAKERLPKRFEGLKIESINSLGQAIGWKEEEKTHLQPAYWNGEELFNLNNICPQDKESPWKKIDAVLDINDQRQIVGIGLTKEGTHHAVLLNPVNPK